MTQRRRFDAISVAALVTAVLAGAAIGALTLKRNAEEKAERPVVQRYAETIAPLAFEGGRVTEQHIKPALGRLIDGTMKRDEFVRLSAGWKRDLSAVRKAFADAKPPPRLRDAARIFDEAFVGYLAAVDEFVRGSATTGTPDQIDDALEPGRVIARRADKTYDRARRLVQAELRRVGLAETLFS